MAQQRAAGRIVPPGYDSLAEFAQLCRDLLEDFGPLWGEQAGAFYRAHPERAYGPGRIPLKHLGFEIGHAQPQTDFLPDCNRRRLFGVARIDDAPLAFIGRVERMDADSRRLADRLGLPAAELPRRNASGFVTGAEGSRGYRAYFDQAARRLVEEIYAADLAFTGCRFGDRRMASFPVVRTLPRRRADRGRAGLQTARRLLARLWFTLCSSEIRLEQSLRGCAPLRRILRPLKPLRGLPRPDRGRRC